MIGGAHDLIQGQRFDRARSATLLNSLAELSGPAIMVRIDLSINDPHPEGVLLGCGVTAVDYGDALNIQQRDVLRATRFRQFADRFRLQRSLHCKRSATRVWSSCGVERSKPIEAHRRRSRAETGRNKRKALSLASLGRQKDLMVRGVSGSSPEEGLKKPLDGRLFPLQSRPSPPPQVAGWKVLGKWRSHPPFRRFSREVALSLRDRRVCDGVDRGEPAREFVAEPVPCGQLMRAVVTDLRLVAVGPDEDL